MEKMIIRNENTPSSSSLNHHLSTNHNYDHYHHADEEQIRKLNQVLRRQKLAESISITDNPWIHDLDIVIKNPVATLYERCQIAGFEITIIENEIESFSLKKFGAEVYCLKKTKIQTKKSKKNVELNQQSSSSSSSSFSKGKEQEQEEEEEIKKRYFNNNNNIGENQQQLLAKVSANYKSKKEARRVASLLAHRRFGDNRITAAHIASCGEELIIINSKNKKIESTSSLASLLEKEKITSQNILPTPPPPPPQIPSQQQQQQKQQQQEEEEEEEDEDEVVVNLLDDDGISPRNKLSSICLVGGFAPPKYETIINNDDNTTTTTKTTIKLNKVKLYCAGKIYRKSHVSLRAAKCLAARAALEGIKKLTDLSLSVNFTSAEYLKNVKKVEKKEGIHVIKEVFDLAEAKRVEIQWATRAAVVVNNNEEEGRRVGYECSFSIFLSGNSQVAIHSIMVKSKDIINSEGDDNLLYEQFLRGAFAMKEFLLNF